MHHQAFETTGRMIGLACTEWQVSSAARTVRKLHSHQKMKAAFRDESAAK